MLKIEAKWHRVCKVGLKGCTKKRVELDRAKHQLVAAPLDNVGQVIASFISETCHRSFRRRQDIARHKCQTTHPKCSVHPPVS